MTEARQLTIASVDGAMPEGWEAGSLFTGEIHPVADLFPMMTDDELDDLAADIKANGLIHPIVLDAEGRLIDGRNRLAACQRAGVELMFSLMSAGVDSVAFILSANIARRHMKKSQQAILVAMARKSAVTALLVSDMASGYGISKRWLNYANVVMKHVPDLGTAVLSGAMELEDAYERARQIKEEGQSDEAKLARLEAMSPELAALVKAGDLTLAGALAEVAERNRKQAEAEQKERDYIRLCTQQFDTALSFLDPRAIPPSERVATWQKLDPSVIGETADFSAARARRVADVLLQYALVKENEEHGKGKE